PKDDLLRDRCGPRALETEREGSRVELDRVDVELLGDDLAADRHLHVERLLAVRSLRLDDDGRYARVHLVEPPDAVLADRCDALVAAADLEVIARLTQRAGLHRLLRFDVSVAALLLVGARDGRHDSDEQADEQRGSEATGQEHSGRILLIP